MSLFKKKDKEPKEIKAHKKEYRKLHKEHIRAKVKKWTEANPERAKANTMKWRKAHPLKVKAFREKWAKAHPLELRASIKKWEKAHPGRKKTISLKYRQTPKGIETIRKQAAKRKQFGFIPLNEYFLGAEGHHINYNYIIYIPKKLHHSIWHSLTLGKGMDEINRKAFKFLKESKKKEMNFGE